MNTSKLKLSLPTAILIAGFLVAGAIIVTNSEPSPAVQTAGFERAREAMRQQTIEVSRDDYTRGNTKDPVLTFIEFSDLDCPYCGVFHTTMQQLVEKYPNDVAWVYRHLPLDQLHPQAHDKAVLAECIGEKKGVEAFWEYVDTLMDERGINATNVASSLGLSEKDVENCLENQRHIDTVDNQIVQAISANGSEQIGTPFTLIVLPNGSVVPMSGAQSFEVLDQVVQAAIEENEKIKSGESA